MSEEITPNEFRRIFPNATASAARRNQGLDVDKVDKDKDDSRGMKIAASLIWEEYLKTGSIHRACLAFGVTGETARKYLLKAGYRLNSSAWTDGEINQLKEAYTDSNGVDISVVARRLSRTHAAIACKAHELFFTSDRGRHIKTASARKRMSEDRKGLTTDEKSTEISNRVKEWHRNNPHPRGMLGKKHTDSSKSAMRAGHIGRKRTAEAVEKQMRAKLAKYGTLGPVNGSGRSWKAGWREIGGVKIYARSKWEANYARYLEWLRQNGEIQSWEHEPETFWFEEIKRGCRSYLPDFKVVDMAGVVVFHEVKGWMDDRSLTKLTRMEKYHPDVTLVLIREKRYKAISRQVGKIIRGWE